MIFKLVRLLGFYCICLVNDNCNIYLMLTVQVPAILISAHAKGFAIFIEVLPEPAHSQLDITACVAYTRPIS